MKRNLAYRLREDGSFLAGDLDAGIAQYAYPSSEWATKAARDPRAVVNLMVSEYRVQLDRTILDHPTFDPTGDLARRNAAWLAELCEHGERV